MSSTTSRDGDRGQVIVLFTLFVFVFLVFAALAFDVGQSMVDRRDQQNAADAAALAGARYLTDPSCVVAPSLANCPKARDAALAAAHANGFGDGATNNATVNGATVSVKIPPGPESEFSNLPGYVEVNVQSVRGSIFSGRWLPSQWSVSSMGVAANTTGANLPYSLMALNRTACPALKISGQGTVNVASNVQVDSACSGALQVQGQASIDVTLPQGAIDVVGTSTKGGTHAGWTPTPIDGAPWQPDPLGELPPPAVPPAPASAVELVGTQPVPAGCPGSLAPASMAAPALCKFTSSYKDTVWRLYPGLYPGGLSFLAGTFYLEPGIYYVAGGGFNGNGNGATIMSVDAGGATFAGGILIYNTQDSTLAPLGPVTLNGSSNVTQLHGMTSGTYAGMVIYQDRTLSLAGGGDIDINGNGAALQVIGTVYAPKANAKINGNGGNLTLTVQIIADTFDISGSSGSTITSDYDGSAFFKLTGVGLVQ